MDACRRVARVFAERGYETWRDNPGTNPVPLRADLTLVSSDKSILQRVIDYADLHYVEESYARSKPQNCHTRVMISSADTVASNLNAEARTPDVRAHLHSEWGLSNVGIGTPRDGVRQFSKIAKSRL